MAIQVRIESRECEAEPGLSLFECADLLGLPITNSCGQQGTCRECLIEVTEGSDLLAPLSEEERHLSGDFRLACRARIRGQSGRIRFRRLRRGDLQILDAGAELPALRRAAPFNPAVAREGNTVLLDGDPIAQAGGPLHGLALDVGTMTVVARLVDLEAGSVRATQAFENPQAFAGSDVMARIAYDGTDSENTLRATLIAYVNHTIEAFPCDPKTIYEVTVAGNPTMRDLFFGLDVGSLGRSPFRSLTEHEFTAGQRTSTSLVAAARQLGLLTHPRARAYGLPLVGSHVGADAAACLLAIDAANEDGLIALMDIGTNTELLIGNRRRMLAASCPAGPAFEGGGIACGMPAFPGAIEAVRLDGTDAPLCRVIGGREALGICGSGLVDALGELLRTGRMNRLGRIGAERFVLDPGQDIYLSEEDIGRLAQAKGAHAAGWTLVMKRYGADYTDIDRLYLAGGFANRLDPHAALRIGLIPDLPRERVRQVGNAAIEGATLALRSLTLRRELDPFVKTIEHVELEADEGFFDAFVEGCQFKPLSAPPQREQS
ncbi:MAG: ferredoxin [Gemmatimonas sp. SM23_52]|nr:MAG: ferredoxin [Gemmatimonas sp. SM23_52]